MAGRVFLCRRENTFTTETQRKELFVLAKLAEHAKKIINYFFFAPLRLGEK